MNVKKVALFASPCAGLILFFVLSYFDKSFAYSATAGIALWTASWWMTEPVPLPVAGMLPLTLFPLFGILDPSVVAGRLGSNMAMLFMGAYMMARGVQKSKVHERIAMTIVTKFGKGHDKIMILAFMAVVAFLSMWMSNTVTTLMMLPVAIAIIDKCESDELSLPLLLGIAFAANVGGIGTPIGTPPNIIFSEIYKEFTGETIGFIDWMMIGVPIIVCFLPLIWLWLTRKVDSNTDFEIPTSGPWRRAEISSLGVFVAVVILWVTRGTPFGGWKTWFDLPNAQDGYIAMLGAVAMFIIPSGAKDEKGIAIPDDRILDWKTAIKIPWGVLLLAGGGFCIAAAFKANGLTADIGELLKSFTLWPSWLLVGMICLIITFLTNLTSNTATTTLLLPVIAAMAITGKISLPLVMIPATISASCAFMLPVGTPPNLMVFATEKVEIKEMIREGFVLNFIAIFIITALCLVIL